MRYLRPLLGLITLTSARAFAKKIFGQARWAVGLALAVLGATGTFLGVPELNARARTEIPGLRCWAPVPMDNAKFTLAMMPFVVVDEKGRVSANRDGYELARLLYTRLDTAFGEMGLVLPYELRSPDDTCAIKGRDPVERATAAAEVAETLSADVLIYGAVVMEDGRARLYPEFYVAYKGFEQASELVGPHEMGRPLRVELPVATDEIKALPDHPLNARARALSYIAMGLAAYAVDDMAQAETYFLEAEATPNWTDNAGKELAYLFLGNTASNLAANTLDNTYVGEAIAYYDQALALNPDFARALVGRANATYQQALGDLQTRKAKEVSAATLDQAEAMYRHALEVPAPAEAEIPLKVHFGLGNVFLVRHYLSGGDWLEQARAEYQAMLAAYDAGGVRNIDLVGHGYGRLALIAAQFDQDVDAAIPLYEAAIDLVTPRWQSFYHIDLGDLYAAHNAPDDARFHYEEALSIAELYGRTDMLTRAEERLAKLP
jgi:tetratricopeptide (TPR) repeat protein